MNSEIKKVLEALDREFDKRALDWLIGLFDGETGGFYYSASARDGEQFFPDIESIVQANSTMQKLGLLDRDENGAWLYPEWYKRIATDFIRSRQDEGDGYFYDPQYKAIANKAKIERNTHFALSFLRSDLKQKPLYPTPMERMELKKKENRSATEVSSNENAGLGVYESEESFLAWLDSITVGRSSYSWGSDLSSGRSMIRAAGFEDLLVDWLIKRQNEENGTWEEEFNMTAVNGVLKLCGFFRRDTLPFPRYEIYFERLIEFTKTFTPTTAAATWNPLGSMRCIIDNLPALSGEIKGKIDSGICEMIRNTTEKMRLFRQADGGFSYGVRGSSTYSNDVIVSTGAPEGDVNATTLMMLVYNEAHLLTGIPHSEPWKEYREYFWENMKKKYDKFYK